jgi:hypothetical protein
MYAVEERKYPVPPPLSMDRIPTPSYPAGHTSLRPSDHLSPVQNEYGGRIWSLEVVQQPIRARMCGFGDKVGAFSAILVILALTMPPGPQTNHSSTVHSADRARLAHE